LNRILRSQNSAGRRILGAQNYVEAIFVGDIDNERDRILQATYPRSAPETDRLLLLIASSSFFTISSKGAVSPASITFTPIILGMTGAVAYGASVGTTLTFPGGVPTLNYGDMASEEGSVTGSITVNGLTYSSVPVTIRKVRDSSDAQEITTSTILDLLEDQITKSQLHADLRSPIELIDGPESNPLTIPGRIKKEADTRTAAINQEISDRIAALVAEAGARRTYVQTYTYSKDQTDSALSIQATAITAAYKSYSDTAKTLAIAASSADVRNYAYSKGDIDSAEATQTSSITANYKSYADGVGAAAVTSANAYAQNYAYSKAMTDSALSSMATTLRAEFTDNNGVSVAYLNNYAFSKAETNSAITSATQTLSTTVGNHTATLQTQATSLDGLSNQLTIKSDINGYVTGYGLASSVSGSKPTSAFIINAGAFSVVSPGVAPAPMFTVGQVGGRTKMVLRGDMYADGDIKASSLAIGGFDNVVPDSNMMDPTFWSRPDSQFVSYPNTDWRSTRCFSLGAEAFKDTFTPMFKVMPGATYLFEYQAFVSGDFQGAASVFCHLPAQAWFPMGGPNRGRNWAPEQGGVIINFDDNSQKGFQEFRDVATLGTMNQLRQPDGSTVGGQIQLRIMTYVARGYIQFGGFRITRMGDSVTIKDGAIKARHVQVDSLQALSNIVIARPGGVGAGQDLDVNGQRIYDPNGVRRWQSGNLDV
jgi:hypothetical protein